MREQNFSFFSISILSVLLADPAFGKGFEPQTPLVPLQLKVVTGSAQHTVHGRNPNEITKIESPNGDGVAYYQNGILVRYFSRAQMKYQDYLYQNTAHGPQIIDILHFKFQGNLKKPNRFGRTQRWDQTRRSEYDPKTGRLSAIYTYNKAYDKQGRPTGYETVMKIPAGVEPSYKCESVETRCVPHFDLPATKHTLMRGAALADPKISGKWNRKQIEDYLASQEIDLGEVELAINEPLHVRRTHFQTQDGARIALKLKDFEQEVPSYAIDADHPYVSKTDRAVDLAGVPLLECRGNSCTTYDDFNRKKKKVRLVSDQKPAKRLHVQGGGGWIQIEEEKSHESLAASVE